MGTRHGEAKVRPDGLVKMAVTVEEATYRELRRRAKAWELSAGEVIEELLANDPVSSGPRGPGFQSGGDAV